jgi:hypothetical protein
MKAAGLEETALHDPTSERDPNVSTRIAVARVRVHPGGLSVPAMPPSNPVHAACLRRFLDRP